MLVLGCAVSLVGGMRRNECDAVRPVHLLESALSTQMLELGDPGDTDFLNLQASSLQASPPPASSQLQVMLCCVGPVGISGGALKMTLAGPISRAAGTT
jgi:hypothetical protein